MKSCGSSNKEALKSSPSLDNEIKHGPTILNKEMADLDQPLSAQFSRKKGNFKGKHKMSKYNG